jgi:hypothetical protein
VKGEDSLDALIAYDSADGEGFVDTSASACDYDAGEYLQTLFVAFPDSAVDVHGIAYFEVRYIFLKAFAFNSIQHLCFHSVVSGIIYYLLLFRSSDS